MVEPNDLITIVLIVAVLAWAGVSITRHWISERAESKRSEIAAGSHKDANTTLLKALETIERVSATRPPKFIQDLTEVNANKAD